MRLLACLFLLCWTSNASAQASCSPTNQYSFSFGAQPATTLNYANSYTYTAATPAGATQTFALSFAANGLTSSTVAGAQMPAISALLTDGANGRTLMVGGNFGTRTTAIATNTRVIRTILTFPVPIRDLTLSVHDVDFGANQYRDWFSITGSNGAASYTPALSTPYGTNNGAGPRSATGSTLTLGPATTPFAIGGGEAVGTSTSPNTAATNGDINIAFPQPVTTVTLRYANYPLTSGETVTGQQAYGLSRIAFCPMPNISVTKSSEALEATGPDRMAIPGAEVIYTITVANTGGSPVDLNGLAITDALPAQTTMFSGDFDGTGPGTTAFGFEAGASGVAMPATGLTFSNNAGSSFAYGPVSDYDPAVNAIRFTPTGSMAANSTFTVRFRARIR